MSSIDTAALLAAMDPDTASRMQGLDVFAEIDSTNSYLMAQPAPDAGMHRVAVADHQTAGRGRGDRRWLSAPGSSLCLSVAYTFHNRLENVPPLTLAVGVAALRALRASGADGLQLKWPNDIVAGNGKLGGMLAESHNRSAGRTTVVIGIGINVDLPGEIVACVDAGWAQAPVDLKRVIGDGVPREPLAAAVVDHVVASLSTFEQQGLGAFAEAWCRYDWLRGRAVTVEQPGGTIRGTASGIDSDGALLVQGANTTTRVMAGSVTADGIGRGTS